MNGKGSKSRVKDIQAFQKNWELIDWGKKSEEVPKNEKTEKEKLLDQYLQEQ